jgi:hypothetical protein
MLHGPGQGISLAVVVKFIQYASGMRDQRTACNAVAGTRQSFCKRRRMKTLTQVRGPRHEEMRGRQEEWPVIAMCPVPQP